MQQDESTVTEIVTSIAKEFGFSKKITVFNYRSDYQDYRLIFDNSHYCEIREKVIDDYLATKNEDLKKEIRFRLENCFELDEFERETLAGSYDVDTGKDIEVDDSEKYNI